MPPTGRPSLTVMMYVAYGSVSVVSTSVEVPVVVVVSVVVVVVAVVVAALPPSSSPPPHAATPMLIARPTRASASTTLRNLGSIAPPGSVSPTGPGGRAEGHAGPSRRGAPPHAGLPPRARGRRGRSRPVAPPG